MFGEPYWAGKSSAIPGAYSAVIYYKLLLAHDAMFIVPKELLLGQQELLRLQHGVRDGLARAGCKAAQLADSGRGSHGFALDVLSDAIQMSGPLERLGLLSSPGASQQGRAAVISRGSGLCGPS